VIGERRARYAGYATRELFVDGRGPCAVFVHGYADSADTWRGVLAELAARGQAALAVDLPGFGHADRRRPGAQLPQLDAFLAELIAARKETGVIAVGNSLGGAVVLRAAQRPDLPIRAVMPINSAGLGFAVPVRLAMYRNGWLAQAPFRVPLPRRLLAAGMRQALPRLLYGDRRSADPVVVRRFGAPITDSRSAAALLRAGAVFSAEMRNCVEPDRLRCPVVIVHGGRDRLVPLAGSRRLHAVVAHSQLRVFPSFGHCPQLDDPVAVAELVLGLTGREQVNGTQDTGAG